MNRAVSILLQLESADSVAKDALAMRCGVAARTISTDVAQLNNSLGTAASIRFSDGRYRLLIVDADAYRRVRDRLAIVQESFNDPQWRAAYILARLLHSLRPVRIEDLTLDMRLGRTSVVADIAQVRELLAPYGVKIEGRTRVGLTLAGPELGIRLAILDHAYAAAYRGYPLGGEIHGAVEQVLGEYGLSAANREIMRGWVTVVLDRYLNNQPLGALPPTYADLVDSPAHDLARALAAAVEPLLNEQLPDDEVLFLALPAAGMRMTGAEGPGGVWRSAELAGALVERILDRVANEMDVRLATAELVREFTQHVTFLVNRLRYSLHLATDAQPGRLEEEYPLAHRMAMIAAEEIQQETGLVVEAGELSLLTTYFQVFLVDYAARQRREMSVTIVSGHGPATARLVRSHLATLLPAGTRYTIVPDCAPGDLDASDLVVTTPGARVSTNRPTLELSELFDRQAVTRRLNALRIPTLGPLAPAAAGSLLVSLIDENRFVRLPTDAGYPEATQLLIDALRKAGLVGEGFEAAIAAREARATMQLDDRLAFPHATDPTLVTPVCALGVVPRADSEAGIRVVFLMAVPQKVAYDDTVLIRVYDEIIRLGGNAAAVAKISRLTSYEQFFYFMENLQSNPTT
jgi:lichenan operon transcriptional antiterminator